MGAGGTSIHVRDGDATLSGADERSERDGVGGRGALPGLGRWGAFPPGKSRGSGHRSLSIVLPNEAITFPGPNFHAGFSPMEKAGNPAGFGASKPALKLYPDGCTVLG